MGSYNQRCKECQFPAEQKGLVLTITFLILLLTGVTLEQQELPNGLDVIIGEDHASSVVTVCVTVNTGATCETPETNGLAHFYEHMFFKGNSALPDQTAYNQRMRELGIIRNGTTGSEVVRYYLTITSDQFEEGMQFMYDAITSPLFNEEEIIREREVIMNEYQRNTAGPWWNSRLAREEVLSVEPWRSSAIGVPEVIQAASREVMLEFQHTYYTPDNAALIITGDIDVESAGRTASEIFGSWEYGGRSNYNELPLNISIEEDTVISVRGPEGIARVSMVYTGPSMADQQQWTYAADVWGQCMSAMTGEFQTRLVTDGPFTSVYASYYSQRFEPTITFGGTIDPDRIDQGCELMSEAISEMFEDDYYTEEGIAVAVEQLRRHRLFKEESSTDMATETLPFWWVQGGGMDYYLEYPGNLASVSVQDVESFVERWIENKPSVTFLVFPEGEWQE